MSIRPGIGRRLARSVAPVALLAACAPSDGAPALPDDLLLERFRQLHSAVYQIYNTDPDRDALHDTLAASFAGEELTDEYVEHFTTLHRMSEERTAIRVLRVDYERTGIVSRRDDRVVVEADWSVGGIVSHQRHRHPRVNRYQARYTLAPAHGTVADVRIVDTQLRNLQRVKSVQADGTFPLDDLPRSSGGLFGVEDILKSGVLDEEAP